MEATAVSGIFKRVEAALEQIRPFLIEDGGNIELLEVSPKMEVKVRFIGACKTCSMNKMTFTAGVEDAILKAVPEIKKVTSVN